MREIEERAKDATAEGKKNVKNAWADTKNAAEKAQNEVESEVDKA